MRRRSLFVLWFLVVAVFASTAPSPGPYKSCQEQGNGGDTILNSLKNRSAPSQSPKHMTLQQVFQLPGSTQVGRSNPRSTWTRQNLQLVAPFEQTSVEIEGFLRRVKQEGPEHCNCERVDLNDFHMWIIAQPRDPPTNAMVVEATPRWRGYNPNWNLNALNHVVAQHARVRITGWLMFDQEHPEQLHAMTNQPATRGTLWELHPVTKIEVFSGGVWKEL